MTTPGVVYIVGNGKIPLPIDDTEIDALQAVIRSGLLIEPAPFLNIGNRVSIFEGPLRGLDGILIDVKSSARLVLSVALLRRSVRVEVDRNCARAAEPMLITNSALNSGPYHGRPSRYSPGKRLAVVSIPEPA